jgi:hypothetical protein
VQKGKFSAGTLDLVRILKNVDFLENKINSKLRFAKLSTNPAFGNPTIPIFRLVPTRPINGFGFASSFFLGGIVLSKKQKLKFTEIFQTKPKRKNILFVKKLI